eukprot:CAMPEP_0114348626 /NCGR_PEP_ID=MMETSP0101-20121206/14854_1 /TAXON_ID=38822 ORGANISM="Pteridomonas danica, Strain PT" /NCGR_SAMPLE_ID=MMETSP0101 /ASSEMBLY_ACC=CAM_ASM_000211 /LENGTH=141 /DNA_ID=CAMNT_0001486655 /DNA_START=448 /DNA_END=870 /DNA_ORIENTATION=+
MHPAWHKVIIVLHDKNLSKVNSKAPSISHRNNTTQEREIEIEEKEEKEEEEEGKGDKVGHDDFLKDYDTIVRRDDNYGERISSVNRHMYSNKPDSTRNQEQSMGASSSSRRNTEGEGVGRPRGGADMNDHVPVLHSMKGVW